MKKVILLKYFLLPVLLLAQNSFELNTSLMDNTFRIEGNGKTGTVFIMAKKIENSIKGWPVLITANHVLNDIKSDTATIYYRKKTNNSYQIMPFTIKIRDNGNPLWSKHPEVDLAAMNVKIPKGLIMLPPKFLVTDSLIIDWGIHPGDKLFCLGYPFGASANEAGFPILRSGVIASYPITPTKQVKEILFDFQIFGGNSGGPVYFIDAGRLIKGEISLKQYRIIIGVISQEFIVSEQIKSLSETTIKKHPLRLAKVIPATFIKELLDSIQIPDNLIQ